MNAVAKVLDRLTGIRETGSGKWICKCPAHDDRSPSLSVRETDDGRVLIHCFAGCGAGEVLAAIGLRMSDLFDKPIAHHLAPIHGGFSARELLELSAHEASVVTLLAFDAQTRVLYPEELERLAQAASRLRKTQDMIRGR